MVDSVSWNELPSRMAGVTAIISENMILALANSHDRVVARYARTLDFVVIDSNRRLPVASIGVALFAQIGRWNVISRFPRFHNDAVVAAHARTLNFRVIYAENFFEILRRMAGITDIRTLDMGRRFGRPATPDKVAGHTSDRYVRVISYR